ncbi:MAG: hypothetical protein AAGB26_12985 [Planctomycetota bacterium]
MSSPTQEEVQARGVVAMVVSVVLGLVCLVMLVGVSGVAFLLILEHGKSAAQAEDHAAELAPLLAEIEAIHVEQAQLAADSQAERDTIRAGWEEEKRSGTPFDKSYFAFVEPKPFTPPKPDRPKVIPEPIVVDTWDGKFRSTAVAPAVYDLSYRQINSFRLDSRGMDTLRVPFAFSKDRTKFFIVDGAYTLRRFDCTTLKEEMRLDLGSRDKCFDMVLTAGGPGLVVSWPERGVDDRPTSDDGPW